MGSYSECRVACGSFVVTDPREALVSKIILYAVSRRFAWYLAAVRSPTRSRSSC